MGRNESRTCTPKGEKESFQQQVKVIFTGIHLHKKKASQQHNQFVGSSTSLQSTHLYLFIYVFGVFFFLFN